ncbi:MULTISPECIES: hypothetical protein [Sediminispirochaeta]|uniref:Uncharacterized protein n=1 Tax=Sediminispirochaeta smaragdinae (strain DSM 11293 / JCM 15392 / SEBR 4228) TaxID=573413 RepID=E1R4H2_SEDSS|nr:MULTISPECIES: hypothetical protein [Sediminispirochaeta]ADK81713.1 conserved hypothetical protein [Sediminispirochaeta smaragdinae DSM 11293]
MQVLGLKEIRKKDLAILYRREFTAVASIKHIGTEVQDKRVSFSIEHLPTGGTHIAVSFLDHIDYPLLPAIKSMKAYIAEQEREGRLS